MRTPQQLFHKHLIRAIVSFAVVMGILLVISVVAKVDFLGGAPTAAGVVAVVFSCALHSAIKEAHDLYSQEQKTSAT